MQIKKIFLMFLVWRLFLFAVLFISLQTIPLQFGYLGGGLSNYLERPYLWAWANFDGEHYLSLARSGYQSLTYFFFPLYPLGIKQFASLFSDSIQTYLLSGLFISHLSFFIALLGIYKLVKLDYGEKVSFLTIFLLLIFPTSFYFASLYTESFFLMFIVWSFYFARLRKWGSSGIVGGLSTATRITGVALLPALLVEYISARRSWGALFNLKNLKSTLSILLILTGLLSYMFFLYKRTGDPLAFYHNLNMVYGDQRANKLITFPQVFYRYIFKIFPSLSYNYFPSVFTTYMEFTIAAIFLFLIVLSFLKLRLSYAMYSLFSYLIPTLSGSFSSLPRYVIVIFPIFLLSALYIQKYSKMVKIIIISILLLFLMVTTSLFTRGYWIS